MSRKLEEGPTLPVHIVTEPDMGYRLESFTD